MNDSYSNPFERTLAYVAHMCRLWYESERLPATTTDFVALTALVMQHESE